MLGMRKSSPLLRKSFAKAVTAAPPAKVAQTQKKSESQQQFDKVKKKKQKIYNIMKIRIIGLS